MIGVVGPATTAERLVEALEEVEGVGEAQVRSGDAEAIVAAEPTVVVGVGEPAVSALARAGVEAPVLPVEAGAGLESVSLSRAPAVVERGVAEGFRARRRPLIEAAVDGERLGRGLFDAMLVTSEPARISEYAVETPGGTDRFRADGVVVATPAGSGGYARAVGGPVLDHDARSLVVVPVAAFTIQPTVRVADAEATLTLRVERDEGSISLLVDGRDVGEVPARRPTTVRVAGAVETVVDGERDDRGDGGR